MILACLILIPLIAGAAAWISAQWSAIAARWIAFLAACAGFALTLSIWVVNANRPFREWLAEVDWPWIPDFGVHFHLAVDGLSLLLLALVFFLGGLAVLASWNQITEAAGFFYLNLLWVLAGLAGVFLAVNLFLFYFAWELMLVPMYFLIAIWGYENRHYAAVKFFLFTQLGGLFMLIAILGLFFVHHNAMGVYTFEYRELLGTPMAPRAELWMMLGFFVAFAVKLPIVGLHTWLPDAHTEAPTAGSVILAGLLLKTGGYGMLRFVVPLFPHAALAFAPVAMALGAAGILYGALLAFGQTDLKRLVAYTSVSHLGFVLLGIFLWNDLALQGALLTMLCHGVSTGALFILVGALQHRLHTREMSRMGGLWSTVPRLSGAALFFALASLGLPGLGDFVGEFLVLLGAYRRTILLASLAAVGVLFATFYALRMIQEVFQGPNPRPERIPDLVPREAFVVGVLIAALFWLGLFPRPVLDTFGPALIRLEQLVSRR
jgi:NADH-quinone oxidoreductase subunit M